MALPQGIASAAGYANEIARLFGLDQWDLQEATYNGVTFQVLAPNPLVANNPFQGVSFPSFSGVTTDNGTNLPYGTKTGLSQVRDSSAARLAIHDIPNRDGTFVEKLGFTGETYTMVGILWGPSYYERLQAMRAAFSSEPPAVPLSSYQVLIHPLNGKITPAYLRRMEYIHASTKFRAVAFVLEFVCDNVVALNLVGSAGNQDALYAALAELENLAISLAEALQISSLLYTRINNLASSNKQLFGAQAGKSNLNPVIRNEVAILNAGNANLSLLLNYATALLYQYLKPPGFIDYTIEKVQVNLSTLPQLFQYVTIFSEKEVDTLVSYYASQAQALIDQYEAFDLGTVFISQINAIKASVVSLDQFGKTLLNESESSYVSYTVPYDMSLRMALYLNGLDLNTDMESMLLLNRSVIGSVNKIPADTILKLRKTG